MFTHPITYRLVLAVRSWFADALPVAAFFVAALAWEAALNHARPAGSQLAGTTGLLHTWVRVGEVPAPPAAIAAVIFAVGLRIGRPTGIEVSAPWLARRAVLYLAAVVLAILALRECAGGFLACYLPFGAALVLPWRLREARRRHDVHKFRRPTRAGFRPSAGALMSLSGRSALSAVDTIDTRTVMYSATISDSRGNELSMSGSIALFRARDDHRSEAYCLARAVELSLTRAEVAQAEVLTRDIMSDEHLSRQPAALCARAEFLAAVGQNAQALALLLRARGLVRRVPSQLQARILEVAADSGRYDQTDKQAWSTWRRIFMIWSGQAATVIVGVAASLQVMARHNPERAIKAAYQLCRLPDRISAQVPSDDFDLISYQRALAAKGMALDVIARIRQEQGRLTDASAASLDAYETYSAFKNSTERVRAARSFIASLAYALSAGHTDPARESHALDLMRALLQVLEDDRGTLLGEDSRSSWIEAQRDLSRLVFRELPRIRYAGAKAGELGFWLLESLHRTMTADLLASNGAVVPSHALLAKFAELGNLERATAEVGVPRHGDDSAEARRNEIRASLSELREAAFIAKPTDLQAALALLGDRHALLYHCWREPAGWAIHAVLVSPQHGIRVHAAQLDLPAAVSEDAAWTTAVGALDALNVGDPIATGLLLASPLDQQPWAELAEALLPASWWDVLCVGERAPINLLVVPDGPIAGLPLGALPVRNGKPLLYYATVAMTPALSVLRPPGEPAHPRTDHNRTAVVHLDDDVSLPEVAYEAGRWQVAARHMRVIHTASQTELEDVLTSEEPPDVVAISVHGHAGGVRLRGGSTLFTESALLLSWPQTVILGACWIGGVRTQAGSEPYGFPVACLLRGADTVLGGIAPVPDAETARILGEVIESLPRDADVARALRDAQQAEADALTADIYPAQIAGLVVWTTASAKQLLASGQIPLHWNAAGLAPETPAGPAGTFTPDPPLSDLAARTLTYSHFLAKGKPAGTLEYLSAAIDTESADWTGFMVACELGHPDLPGKSDETDAGTVAVTTNGGKVITTTALGKALRLGQMAADYLGDETLLPRHIVLAGLCDADSAACQWLSSHRSDASRDWRRHLGDRIFRTTLPEPNVILGLEDPPPEVTSHDLQIAGASLDEKALRSVSRRLNWRTPLAVGALILILPLTQRIALPRQAVTPGRSALGVVFSATSGRGAEIAAVLPASPAARAGLRTGDLITTIDGSPISSLSAAQDAINSRQPGSRISITIIRAAHSLNIHAVLGQPIVFKNPAYIGVSVHSEPTNGVLVVSVTPGGPAATAGLRAGDIITAVSGQADGGSAVGTVLLIQRLHPGQLVQLSVIRRHQTMTIEVIAVKPPVR